MLPIEETTGNIMTTRAQDQIITSAQARKVLQENQIEMGVDDPRSAIQYVTELLVVIKACEQDDSPYKAR